MGKFKAATYENTAVEAPENIGTQMEKLTPEQEKELNLTIAREGSWLNALFQEYNMSAQDKQEVLRRVIQDVKKKELKTA